MVVLCVDVGNTEIDVATYVNDKLISRSSVETHGSAILDFITLACAKSLIKNVAISSVAPSIEQIIIEKLRKINISYFSVSHLNSTIKLEVDSPNEVGNDRICNIKSVIQNKLNPAIIIDFGSATTYDVINKDNEFIGGIIAPGIDVSAQNLFERAEQLKQVDFQFPKSVIGKNTITNLQSGIMYGGVDAVNGMIKRIKKELGNNIKNIVLTGGFASVLSPKIKHPHRLEPNLTLNGIKLLWEESLDE